MDITLIGTRGSIIEIPKKLQIHINTPILEGRESKSYYTIFYFFCIFHWSLNKICFFSVFVFKYYTLMLPIEVIETDRKHNT